MLADNAGDAITGGRRDVVTEVVNDYSHATGAQVLIIDAAGEPLARRPLARTSCSRS